MRKRKTYNCSGNCNHPVLKQKTEQPEQPLGGFINYCNEVRNGTGAVEAVEQLFGVEAAQEFDEYRKSAAEVPSADELKKEEESETEA